MTFLLDTNVISELQRTRRNAGVQTWWNSDPARDSALSAVTIGEIERGLAKLMPRNPVRARELRGWLDETLELFAGCIISLDQRVAQEWGRMSADRSRAIADTMIAATAKVHDLTLVTRNTRDVEGLGIRVLNPFS